MTPDDSHCPHHSIIFSQINKGAENLVALSSLWEHPPCSLMKTPQVFTVIVKAIKNGLLQPFMTLKRDQHFHDKTPDGRNKLVRSYLQGTELGHFEPMLSWCINPSLPEKLKGKKSISAWATLLLKDEEANVDFVTEAIVDEERKSSETGVVHEEVEKSLETVEVANDLTSDNRGQGVQPLETNKKVIDNEKPQTGCMSTRSGPLLAKPLASVVHMPISTTNMASDLGSAPHNRLPKGFAYHRCY